MPAIFRPFLEKLGGETNAASYVGTTGDLFYDPTTTTLRVSDGSTPGGVVIGAGGGGISNVVEDTTPQLGGSLDVNGQTIVSTGNGNISIVPDEDGDVIITTSGTGIVSVTGDISVGGDVALDGTLSVNVVEGNGAEGVTRLLLQGTQNGNAYVSIPTDDASTTDNLVIGNEVRGVEFVGAVVLDSTVNDPNLLGGSNVTPTGIPLTQGYVILNEGAGGLGYFNLPDGQEGQIIHLVMGSTDSLLASDINVRVTSGRYLFAPGGGGQQAFTGTLDVKPFTEIPTAMVTMLYAGGYWTVTHGTVTEV
jgi:hypothetical protein